MQEGMPNKVVAQCWPKSFNIGDTCLRGYLLHPALGMQQFFINAAMSAFYFLGSGSACSAVFALSSYQSLKLPVSASTSSG
ncbi:hypothetical protein Y032_0420g1155 [Ancylostoma ceylanicum]|nr:hypothetical protein Y032_0420g1155 [Ancylostoma ceylanicum]